MCDVLIPLLALGALTAFSGIGQSSGCGPVCAPAPTYAASYGYTPCAGGAYVGGGYGPHYASSYSYYGGAAPTASYMSGTQYYGYSAGYGTGGYGVSAGAGYSPYASASTYYGY